MFLRQNSRKGDYVLNGHAGLLMLRWDPVKFMLHYVNGWVH